MICLVIKQSLLQYQHTFTHPRWRAYNNLNYGCQVQVVEAMSFIWVTYRSKNDLQTAESPKPSLVWVIFRRSWEARAHRAAYRQLKELRVFFPRDRPNPPPSNLIGFCLSQSDGLIAESSLWLGLFILWKKRSNDFVQFQRLLEALLSC